GLAAQATAANNVNLSWTASSGATSYTVQVATVSGGPYTVLSAPGFTLTTFDHTTAGANIVYYYQVLATNGSGSTPTPQLRFRAPPPVPTGLAASIDGSGRCAGCVRLSWSSAQRVQGFTLRRTGGAGPVTLC